MEKIGADELFRALNTLPAGMEDSVVSPLPPVDVGIKNLYRGPLALIGIEEKGGADPYQVLPRAFIKM